jgi:hypothetical protein
MIARCLLAVFIAVCSFAPGGAAQAQPRAKPVGVGEMAPDFSLNDQNGRRHTLSAQRGKQPVVLIFYRGHW